MILSCLSLGAAAQTLLDPGASAGEGPSADFGSNSFRAGGGGCGVVPGTSEELLHPAAIPAGAPRGTFSIGARDGSGTGTETRSQWMVVFLDQNERAFPGAHTLDSSSTDTPSADPAKGSVAAPKKNENAPVAGPDKPRSGPLFRLLRLAVPGLVARVLVNR